MKSVRIAELKDGLSRHLRAVRRGGSFTVLDRDTPIARVVPWTPDGAALAVHGPARPWSEILRLRLPPRLPLETDSLAALLDEREGAA